MKNKYFDLKIVDDKFVVTNSSLTKINPDQGGSPQAFKAFYEQEAKEPTPSMEMGKMIHLYQENPDEFIISDIEKPAEGIVKWVEEIYFFLSNTDGIKDLSGNIEIKYKDKKNIENEVAEIHNIITYVKKECGINENFDVTELLSLILYCRNISDYDQRLSTIVALEQLKVKGGVNYLKFLSETSGKIILTSKDKERIENTIKSLCNHPKSSELLFSGFNNGNDYFTFKEHYIVYNKPNSDIIQAGLIDNFQLDFINRAVILSDLKTTSNNPLYFLSNDKKEGLIQSLQIDRQLAYYEFLIKRLISGEAKLYNHKGEEVIVPVVLSEDRNKWKFYRYVVVGQTVDFHKCLVVELSQVIMFEKTNYFNSLLNRIQWHIDNNEWQYNKEEIENNYTYKL